MVRRYLKIVIIAAVTALFVVFAVANRELTTITLFPFPYSAEMPKFLLVSISFGLGILFAGLALGARSHRSRRLYKSEQKRAMALENELQGVKAQSGSLPSAPL